MPDRITIRDLARIAGVSTATVSLALRDSHRVSAETRERVQALAQEHGYRSHPAVNTLMQQVRSGGKIHDEETLAFIRSGRDLSETACGPLELLAGVEREAFRLGYRVEIFWAGDHGAKSEQLGRILYHRGIRGVIWGPMPYPHPPLVFPWEHFAPIACTNSTDVAGIPVVTIHHGKGMALLIEELTRRGAQRIGVLISQEEDLRQDYAWISGVDLFRHRGGRTLVESLTCKSFPGKKRVTDWIGKHRLDALIVSHRFYQDLDFLGDRIAKASLDVPTDDLGTIAGLHQDMSRIGQHAVRSLSIRLSNSIMGLPENSFSVVTLATFREGASLDPLARLEAPPSKSHPG